MKEKFTMDKYADLLEKDIKQATLYKDKFVPDRLYKYQPLGLGRMRSKRIQTIKKEEIWASRVEYLNDPFEFRFLYKGIIINHNKKLSQPTLKRRFFKKKAAFFSWPGLGKEWC